jgi:hypothetical protein
MKKNLLIISKQVIYLISSPLSLRDFGRFGIKNWVDCGWKVKVYDFTSFLYPKYWKHVDGEKLSVNFDGLTIFQNINEALTVLKNLQNKVVFIDLLGYSSKEQKIRSIARYHGLSVKLELGSIPQVNADKNFLKLLNLIKNPIVLVKKLILFLQNRLEKIRAIRHFPDYLVVSGTKSMLGVNRKKTSVIKAHNLDYDFLIQEKQIKPNKNRNFIVFLDEDGPYHSDFIHREITPFLTPENYYSVMDLGLYEIAKSLKLNIKIAAHPRSNYGAKQIKYKHPILEKKTFELIRGADVVVGHASTALQLAVIMKKPIILVTTQEIQNAFYARHYVKHINCFATILGKKVVNLSDLSSINNWTDYLNVDEEKYEKYIEAYIKTKRSPEKLAWNIVIENIERDLLL